MQEKPGENARPLQNVYDCSCCRRFSICPDRMMGGLGSLISQPNGFFSSSFICSPLCTQDVQKKAIYATPPWTGPFQKLFRTPQNRICDTKKVRKSAPFHIDVCSA